MGEDEPDTGLGAFLDHVDVGPAPGNPEHQVGPHLGQPGHGQPGEAGRSGQ